MSARDVISIYLNDLRRIFAELVVESAFARAFRAGRFPPMARRLHISFGFASSLVYIAADQSLNGHTYRAASLLDICCGSPSLSLGYAICEGQGNVARREFQAGRHPGA